MEQVGLEHHRPQLGELQRFAFGLTVVRGVPDGLADGEARPEVEGVGQGYPVLGVARLTVLRRTDARDGDVHQRLVSASVFTISAEYTGVSVVGSKNARAVRTTVLLPPLSPSVRV